MILLGGALVASTAVVEGDVTLEDRASVEGVKVPPAVLVAGVPAREIRAVTAEERDRAAGRAAKCRQVARKRAGLT